MNTTSIQVHYQLIICCMDMKLIISPNLHVTSCNYKCVLAILMKGLPYCTLPITVPRPDIQKKHDPETCYHFWLLFCPPFICSLVRVSSWVVLRQCFYTVGLSE